ncbi:ferredoxin--NADP reductase [Pseudoalteromonas denitrificans]|jgi:ferredoxin--NADP+ reductase|uniref:ferredoxin--NADP(+) reductase n=1 Tax=Pseudoalteromonas denitrificans DSM 6059 TaxID=1123010 RepID=A0A1I1FMY9_9GAMM|nr:ferredoxin--NADP reductase [Pseudoalteromonas denitrificans]SFC00651.1 ferredoxin--NADP+ reductase [Pseudoalteromonas denitrificans DSM 6059]
MAKWLTAKVKNIKWWNDKLFSIIVNAPINSFQAGQFTKLAMNVNSKRIARAYSFVNASNNKDLEFYLVKVEQGKLTCPLSDLKVGDKIEISQTASGFFTLDEVPKSEQLWLLSTGTAIGPFLSILQQGEVWHKFKEVILVHGVREKEDLSYQYLIQTLCDENPQLKFVSILSRQKNPSGLTGRIPSLIASGELMKFIDLKPEPKLSQFMICGNPDMVKETSLTLNKLGYERNRRRTPGNITVEQYW